MPSIAPLNGFAAKPTSEKIALGHYLDGKVSAVIGTHTHVQTADEQIFPGGTAFLCDAGMCGPVEGMAHGEVRLRGALVTIDEISGRAQRIQRIDEPGTENIPMPESDPVPTNE